MLQHIGARLVPVCVICEPRMTSSMVMGKRTVIAAVWWRCQQPPRHLFHCNTASQWRCCRPTLATSLTSCKLPLDRTCLCRRRPLLLVFSSFLSDWTWWCGYLWRKFHGTSNLWWCRILPVILGYLLLNCQAHY